MQGLESLSQFQNFVSTLGGLGRYGDTYMIHAEEGETVVPMEVLDRNPVLKKRLFKSMKALGIDPGRYIVGNDLNSLNPVTGQPEFFLKWVGRRLRKAAADISGYAAPIAGAMYGPAAGALVGGALGQYKRENPGDPSQWQQMALRGGLTGLAANLASGQGFTPFGGARGIYVDPKTGAKTWNPMELGERFLEKPSDMWDPFGPETTPVDASKGWYNEYESIKNSDVGTKILAEFGQEGGKARIAKLAETAAKTKGKTLMGGMNFKEMLGLYAAGTIGLGALIDMTSSDEDVGTKIKPYEPHGQYWAHYLNPASVVYSGNQGGIVGYNRGGVMDLQGGGESRGPGTGTSDSIPAMLSDGEFVMTADAVRGAGGGDRREGARRMYEAMDRLEARA